VSLARGYWISAEAVAKWSVDNLSKHLQTVFSKLSGGRFFAIAVLEEFERGIQLIIHILLVR
jgi:hypothetical protein